MAYSKTIKWTFYIFTFFLITVVATVLSAMKPGDKVPDVSNAILIVGVIYGVIYMIIKFLNRFRKEKCNNNQNKKRCLLFSKQKKAYLILVALVFLIAGIFYWYEVRPARIKHYCSWVKKHSNAIPERSGVTEEELFNSGLIEDCEKKYPDNEYSGKIFGNLSKEFCQDKNQKTIKEYSIYKPYEPAKNWKVEATKEEYEFCLHNKGL